MCNFNRKGDKGCTKFTAGLCDLFGLKINLHIAFIISYRSYASGISASEKINRRVLGKDCRVLKYIFAKLCGKLCDLCG